MQPGQPVRVHTIYGEAIDATFVAAGPPNDATAKALRMVPGSLGYRFAHALNGHMFTRYTHEIQRIEATF